MNLNEMRDIAHDNAVDKGFWQVPEEYMRRPAEYAFLHMLLSKAMEANRKSDELYEFSLLGTLKECIDLLQNEEEVVREDILDTYAPKLGRISLMHSELSETTETMTIEGAVQNEGEEMADVLIRIGDYAGGYKIDIEEEVKAKMKKNAGRPQLHGKKY